MKTLRYLWSLVLALALAAPAFAQLKEVPQLTGRVVDQAGMLDAGQRGRLEAMLADYEAKTGSQIAVLLVKTTEPEVIEQYSIRVADAWKLGRKGVDDGVLLMVARDNPKALRRLRIEAGRGVQGVLTDAQSKRVLQDVIAPYFRQNQYYEGLSAGVGALEHLLDKEKFPAPPQRAQSQPQSQQSGAGSWSGLVVGLIVILVIASIFRRSRRQFGGLSNPMSNSSWGSGTTGFILGSILSDQLNRRNHDSGFGGGGFGGGGLSGGGGFSGGGGSFDGGGASGDW
jgi:uncharacterized protein